MNEICLYLFQLMLLSINTFSAQISGVQLYELEQFIESIICGTIVINLILISYALTMPFHDA